MRLIEADGPGTSRVKTKMAEAHPARLQDRERVDWALGNAAMFARFANGDPTSIHAANPPGMHRSAYDILVAGRHPSMGRLRRRCAPTELRPEHAAEVAELLEFIPNGSPPMTNRLLHHAHVVVTTDSIRPQTSNRGQRVMPLTN